MQNIFTEHQWHCSFRMKVIHKQNKIDIYVHTCYEHSEHFT